MTKNIYFVKVHCGSAHVRGKARNYPYYVASLFKLKRAKDGHLYFVNTGISTYPRRSNLLATKDGIYLAANNDALFCPGYGSLHNTKPDIHDLAAITKKLVEQEKNREWLVGLVVGEMERINNE
jgi:hypothetical protein